MLVDPTASLHQHLVDSFNASRLVHDNVVKVGQAPRESEPPSASASGTATPVPTAAPAVEDKDDEELPDTDERSIANTRAATAADGIRALDDLMAIGRDLMLGGARSAYGNNKWGTETFADRAGFPPGVTGAGGGEPAYTCFTPKFHLTLGKCNRMKGLIDQTADCSDYLFLVPSPAPSAPRPEFTSLLATPPTEALGTGLPRKGVSASDHLPVGCEIEW
jgi:RNA exonuclease NGL2